MFYFPAIDMETATFHTLSITHIGAYDMTATLPRHCRTARAQHPMVLAKPQARGGSEAVKALLSAMGGAGHIAAAAEAVAQSAGIPEARDREAVEAMLAAVNGRAGAFTTATYMRVRDIAARAEAAMASAGISQAERAGTTVVHVGEGPTAKSYKRAAIATMVRLARDGKGAWRLIAAERATVWPCERERMVINISAAAAEAVARRAMAPFRVAKGSR